MTRCSIVLLSWSRPENIDKISLKYQNYECVDEILVWNNNNAFLIHNFLPKVKVINGNSDLGLNTRFAAALLCKNRCVILHDDDLILSEGNLAGLIKGFDNDCSRIYTFEGRDLLGGAYNRAGQCRVERVTLPTEADVALTRATCFDRLLATEYFKLCDVVFYDVALCLNGEDILLSFISKNVYGKKPLVLPLVDEGYEDLPVDADEKISERPHFLAERNKIVNRCKIILPTPEYPIGANTIFGGGHYPFGYLESSTCYNSIHSKFLVKQTSGIKHLSMECCPESDFAVGSILLEKPIKVERCLSLGLFTKHHSPCAEIHLTYLAGAKTETKTIQLGCLESNLTKQFEIPINELSDQGECYLTDIKFVVGNKKQSCELCIVNLSFDD